MHLHGFNIDIIIDGVNFVITHFVWEQLCACTRQRYLIIIWICVWKDRDSRSRYLIYFHFICVMYLETCKPLGCKVRSVLVMSLNCRNCASPMGVATS